MWILKLKQVCCMKNEENIQCEIFCRHQHILLCKSGASYSCYLRLQLDTLKEKGSKNLGMYIQNFRDFIPTRCFLTRFKYPGQSHAIFLNEGPNTDSYFLFVEDALPFCLLPFPTSLFLPLTMFLKMVGRQSSVQKETKSFSTGWEPLFTLQIRIVGSGRSEACWHVGLFSGSFWDVYDKNTMWEGGLFPNN